MAKPSKKDKEMPEAPRLPSPALLLMIVRRVRDMHKAYTHYFPIIRNTSYQRHGERIRIRRAAIGPNKFSVPELQYEGIGSRWVRSVFVTDSMLDPDEEEGLDALAEFLRQIRALEPCAFCQQPRLDLIPGKGACIPCTLSECTRDVLCVICQDAQQIAFRRLKCGHWFHGDCIEKVIEMEQENFQHEPKCPTCNSTAILDMLDEPDEEEEDDDVVMPIHQVEEVEVEEEGEGEGEGEEDEEEDVEDVE